MAPRETENNAYAKFWGNKQRALWYVMVFSGVVNWFALVLFHVLPSFVPILLSGLCEVLIIPLNIRLWS